MKKTAILYLSVLAFTTIASYGQQLLNNDLSLKIDTYINEEIKERQIPGLALAIVKNGKIIKEKGYGLADIQNQVPVKVNTIFELASITKQFTASAIMILQQEGKLDVDDKIGKHLSDAPDNWNAVTIRHLLTHTSGLPVIGEGFSGVEKMTREQLLQLGRANYTKELAYTAALHDTLHQPPGEKYVYSDVAYFLLGVIIENASGMSYREFMQKRIFDPVKMDDTYILDQVKIHPNEARGYTLRNGELVNIRRIWEFEVPSHYGIFSTVGDLAKWDKALYSNHILSDESKAEMWKPMMRNNGIPSPYGFGWTIWFRNKEKIIDHTGITGTQITRFLDDQLTIIVLTNLGHRGTSRVNAWGIGPKIGAMLGSNTYINGDYVTLTGAMVLEQQPISDYDRLAGTYRMLNNDSHRELYVEDGKLYYRNDTTIQQIVALNNGQYLMLGTTDEWLLEKVPGEQHHLQWRFKGQKTSIMEKKKL